MSVWLIPIVLLAVAWSLYRLRKRQLADLAQYEIHVEIFYDAAKPLVEDDETPELVLELLKFMNEKVSDPSAARELYQIIARGRLSPVTIEVSPEGKKLQAFFKKRPELEPPFLRVIGHGLLAMTYRSMILGSKLRLWLSAIDTPKRQEEVAYTYRDLDRHDGQGMAPAAA